MVRGPPSSKRTATLFPDTTLFRSGMNTGIDLSAGAMPADAAVRGDAVAATKGALIAWDPVAQKERWRVPHASPWNGGLLSTAGGLVFQGNAAEIGRAHV